MDRFTEGMVSTVTVDDIFDQLKNNENDDFTLKLSNITTKSFPWKPLDELNYVDTKTVNKMINDGKRYLFKIDNDKYAYICNILDYY